MEMELKLLVDAEDRHLVEQHPAFAAVTPKTRKATTTYYDTADFALYRLGACLRVRQSADGFVQTVKLDRAEDQLGSRGEWEWPLSSATPDLGTLSSLPRHAAPIREAAIGLEPLFSTIVERTSRLIACEDGTQIEAVVDRGTIRAGAKSLAISEVELELKQGSPGQVFRLALDLAERARLRYGPHSKSQRGYQLLCEDLPVRPDTGLPIWDADVSIGKAFPNLVHAALRELAAEIPAVSKGDVEGIHRMRAAIRKLRSILVLFDRFIERRAAKRFMAALRDLGGILGRGRDWDVFLTETLPRAEAGSGGAAVGPLRGPAERERAAAHAAITQAMRGHPLTALILGMGAWMLETQWLRKVEPDARLADLIPGLLDELDRKARRKAHRLDIADVEDLHSLRKSLKKLRYSLDSMRLLFEPKDVAPTLHVIKDLLGILGDLNDAAVTEQRVEEIAAPDKPELAPAAAALLRENDRRRAKAMGKLPKRLRHFHDLKPFWA